MLVSGEPEFEKYCNKTYILGDDEEDDIHKVSHDDDCGYFSDNDLPIQDMTEVSNEWFVSHLMDNTDMTTKDAVGDAGNSPKTEDIFLGDRKPPPEIIRLNRDDALVLRRDESK